MNSSSCAGEAEVEFIIFIFDHMVLQQNKIEVNFEIAGDNKVYLQAEAKMSGNKIVVSNSTITNLVYVRYAWSDSSSATLYNKEGLPAATFTSEK